MRQAEMVPMVRRIQLRNGHRLGPSVDLLDYRSGAAHFLHLPAVRRVQDSEERPASSLR